MAYWKYTERISVEDGAYVLCKGDDTFVACQGDMQYVVSRGSYIDELERIVRPRTWAFRKHIGKIDERKFEEFTVPYSGTYNVEIRVDDLVKTTTVKLSAGEKTNIYYDYDNKGRSRMFWTDITLEKSGRWDVSADITLDYYVEDETGKSYTTLPGGAVKYGTAERYRETSEFYKWELTQDTTWTPPKEGMVRVLVEAAQYGSNYAERVVRDIYVEKHPYTLRVGSRSSSEETRKSRFGTVVATSNSTFPRLLDKRNGENGYVQITYLEEVEE